MVNGEASTEKDAKLKEEIDYAELRKLHELLKGFVGVEVADLGYKK